MIRKPFLALVAIASLAASGAALAEDITMVRDDFRPQLTREQVQQQVLAAKADGSFVTIGEVDATPVMPRPSTVSRQAVQAEARADAGRLAGLYLPG